MAKTRHNSGPIPTDVLATTILLMMGIVGLLLIPAFYYLSCYQSYLLYIIPENYYPHNVCLFVIQAFISTCLMMVGLVAYTDIAFPLAMLGFGVILNNVNIQPQQSGPANFWVENNNEKSLKIADDKTQQDNEVTNEDITENNGKDKPSVNNNDLLMKSAEKHVSSEIMINNNKSKGVNKDAADTIIDDMS
ncbi:unnamed protein product [Bursaphelenchus okinawaensis]|uniref:Uncharacterized protein n=1 Tax=Bursaphelenchus okinawaensis TaxID=465554 RepID=A0A811LJ78_9BILA|nr:unnamed protein product [Bursaphelenchus okinawaensis]CAG9123457.1 unnamed protein product [Bursaphelenchus okinawaensis]